jgi:hypothetical protein
MLEEEAKIIHLDDGWDGAVWLKWTAPRIKEMELRR